MRNFLLLVVAFFIGQNNYAQINCDKLYSSNEYYFVSKKVSKKQFKKEKITSDEKSTLKKELTEQISTNISVFSIVKSGNVVSGESGEYNSYRNKEIFISSIGAINNPGFVYCKTGNKYSVYCVVKKVDFDNDLYNTLSSKVKIFNSSISSLLSINYSTKNLLISLSDLKRDYYYLSSGLEFVSKSNYISDEKKQNLSNEISQSLGNFNKLDNLLVADFDNKLKELNGLLDRQEYQEINSVLYMWTIEKLSLEQQSKLNVFKSFYEKSINSYIKNLQLEIETEIRKRSNEKKDELLKKYLTITFYKDNLDKYNYYLKQFTVSTGFARTNLYFGINAGSTFQNLDKQGSSTNLNGIESKFTFNQVLPSVNLGFKHFLFNPSKRIGFTVVYKKFSNSLIQLGKTEVENSIKDFSVIQGGLILGPLEMTYGTLESKFNIEKLNLLSLKLGIFRSDKLLDKYSKSNYLDIFVIGDYLSDFKDNTLIQVGVGINYNLAFNRTRKY
jgi:hypothetical protein